MEKELVHHIPEPGDQKAHQIDPSLHGVYQHSKIQSLVGWLEVRFLHIDDNPQIHAELENLAISAGEVLAAR